MGSDTSLGYRPRWLRPLGLALVAASLVLQIIFVGHGPFWVLVLLLLPASVGTGLFGAANSAAVLNATPSDNYGFASGMLETTRHFAHTIGTIVALGLITLVVPEHGAPLDLQADYLTGFRLAAMCVFAVALGGAALAFVHQPQRERANQPLLAASA